VQALELATEEVDELAAAGLLDWSSVEPSIFGTLFERSLDPGQRAQLGAHYTGRPDIERVVEPVVLQPLRRKWEAIQEEVAPLIARRDAATTPQVQRNREAEIARTLDAFTDELAAVRVLDPACGSGNFLICGAERAARPGEGGADLGRDRGGAADGDTRGGAAAGVGDGGERLRP
jgi:hypothetical protein